MVGVEEQMMRLEMGRGGEGSTEHGCGRCSEGH
jgi:hypothetical protein